MARLQRKWELLCALCNTMIKKDCFPHQSESEGGRRLYTDKDLVMLHQIISLKSLGFSLDDIKERLISLETPADVANCAYQSRQMTYA